MTDRNEAVRLAIYHGLAETGQLPSTGEIARQIGLDPDDVDAAVDALAANRHIAFDEDHQIVLAHPFATRNFGFSVMGERTLWWGGCAWDSFAIPHLVPDEPSVLVATTCPACEAPHAWVIERTAEPAGTQVAHFLTPVSRIWDDVVHACGNQRIFCSVDCVDAWLKRTGNERGSVFDLPTLWRLASHWYDGRLDTPYRRREPEEAAGYFASVGLTGAFWETDFGQSSCQQPGQSDAAADPIRDPRRGDDRSPTMHLRPDSAPTSHPEGKPRRRGGAVPESWATGRR